MAFNQRLTKEQARPKIRQYCAYQERCHQEVKEKLYGYGLYSKDVDLVLSELIEENFLNEERFAIQFAGGKFRVRQWGRKKISYALKHKQVSPYCIKMALKQITEADYEKTLRHIAEKKWLSLKGEQWITREAKTKNYLLQKGYEPELISKIVKAIKSEN